MMSWLSKTLSPTPFRTCIATPADIYYADICVYIYIYIYVVMAQTPKGPKYEKNVSKYL